MHKMEFHAAEKQKEILEFTGKWMEMETMGSG